MGNRGRGSPHLVRPRLADPRASRALPHVCERSSTPPPPGGAATSSPVHPGPADGLPKLLDSASPVLSPLAATEIAETSTHGAMGLRLRSNASPEQVRGGGVTTASDVYSLEWCSTRLLTGQRPTCCRAAAAGRGAGVWTPSGAAEHAGDARRRRRGVGGGAVQEILGDPQRRSRQHSGGAPQAPCRRPRHHRAGGVAQGPDRRYPSVEHISEDLRRHLAGLPSRRAATGSDIERPSSSGATGWQSRRRLWLLSLAGGLTSPRRRRAAPNASGCAPSAASPTCDGSPTRCSSRSTRDRDLAGATQPSAHRRRALGTRQPGGRASDDEELQRSSRPLPAIGDIQGASRGQPG